MADVRTFSISNAHGNEYILSGDLTFATINKNTLAMLPLTKQASAIILNLQNIQKTDSAGLALMIEWMKLAQSKQVTMQLKNLPEQLINIANLSGLDEIIIENYNTSDFPYNCASNQPSEQKNKTSWTN